MEAKGEVSGDEKKCDKDATGLKGVFTVGEWRLWLRFGWRDVNWKAIIGVPGFWGERAAEGGYLVWGFYNLKGIFSLLFLQRRK